MGRALPRASAALHLQRSLHMRRTNALTVAAWVRGALGAAIAVAASLPACSSDSPSSGSTATGLDDAVDSGAADGSITCDYDPQVVPYAAGLREPGGNGILSFVLVSANPAPPALGLNEWTVEVLDSSGTAQVATFVQIKPWMPYHGHGASVVPTVTGSANGSYLVSDLDFFMVGVWQVTFDAQTAAGSDSAVFTFCVGE